MKRFYTFEQMEADHQALHNKFLDEDPDEPVARYKYFKDYYGEFFYCQYLMEYAQYAITDDNIESLLGALQELNEVRNDERIKKGSDSRNRLYVQAQRVMVDFQRGIPLTKHCDYETLVLMSILLHENEYFNAVPVHEDFFKIGQQTQVVAAVYGEYFLFYNYLKRRLKKLQPNSSETTQTLSKGEPETFEELFFDNHVYKKVIERLSKPLDERIANAGEIVLGTKLVEVICNKIYWNISIKKKPRDSEGPLKKGAGHSYLAGLYEACLNLKLIERQEERVLLQTATTSFNLQMSRSAFSKMYAGTLDEKYIEPFMLLLKDLHNNS